ncbi:MAG: AEC family transporter [Hyphomonadaceae bacterium]
MLASLSAVLPVFALILVGWIAAKTKALGPAATREVNRLVVQLALPALLFDIVANASLDQIWQPNFILAFGLGCAIVFALTIFLRLRQGRRLADAAIDSLNASYANTGFIGFPLVLAAVGDSVIGLTLVANLVTVCVLFGVALVLVESGLQTGGSRRDIGLKTLSSLARNPLIIAPALGAAVLASGWTLPAPVQTFLDLLGGAASPCALIALGLFMANTPSRKGGGGTITASLLVCTKLIVHPAITWLIAGPILRLPSDMAFMAVLLAALPTGTGPFMLAEFYEREATLTSRVVLLSTILSLLTVSAYLAFAHP